jgi:hypothetical protein
VHVPRLESQWSWVALLANTRPSSSERVALRSTSATFAQIAAAREPMVSVARGSGCEPLLALTAVTQSEVETNGDGCVGW